MDFFPMAVRSDPKVLRRQFLDLALVHHPDKVLDPTTIHAATEKFQGIQAAYDDLLSNINHSALDAKPSKSKSLLCIVCELGDLSEVQRLLKSQTAFADDADQSGKTPLMFAVQGGSLDICKELHHAGATIDAHNRLGWTPLVFSAIEDNAEIARWLIDSGATVTDKVIKMAAHMGSCRVLELLLSRDASTVVDLVDDGYSTLHVALRGLVFQKSPIEKHYRSVCMLLDAGCDVCARGPKNETVLMMFVSDLDQPWAASELDDSDLYLEVVQQLCDMKADPCEVGPDGLNAAEVANSQDHFRLHRLLQTYGVWA